MPLFYCICIGRSFFCIHDLNRNGLSDNYFYRPVQSNVSNTDRLCFLYISGSAVLACWPKTNVVRACWRLANFCLLCCRRNYFANGNAYCQEHVWQGSLSVWCANIYRISPGCDSESRIVRRAECSPSSCTSSFGGRISLGLELSGIGFRPAEPRICEISTHP